MANKSILFLSDTHIDFRNRESFFCMNEFIQNIDVNDVSTLVLAGDIFDLWLSSQRFFIRSYSEIIDSLKIKIKAGLRVIYFEGNHDLFLHHYWPKLGVEVYRNGSALDLEGYKVFIEHGDEFMSGDTGYKILKNTLRSFPIDFLIRVAPWWLVDFVANKIQKYGGTRHGKKDGDSKVVSPPAFNYEKYTSDLLKRLESILKKTEVDWHFCGHHHINFDKTINIHGHTVRAVNLDSWLESPKYWKLDIKGLECLPLSFSKKK